MSTAVWDAAVCSAKGQRVRNEDFGIADPDCAIAVVADGVGGGPDGDVMSRLVARSTFAVLSNAGDMTHAMLRLSSTLSNIVHGLPSSVVHERASTALAVGAVRNGYLIATAIGDCRVSVISVDPMGRPYVRCSTQDQNQLTFFAMDGLSTILSGQDLDPEFEADARQRARYLTGRVPASPLTPPGPVMLVALAPSDTVVVTSDGVHDTLGPTGLETVITDYSEESSRIIGEQIVAAALAQGSEDNCTAAVLRARS